MARAYINYMSTYSGMEYASGMEIKMRVLVKDQEIVVPRVCVLPDLFETTIILEDASGIFYQARCTKDTIITVREDITGWSDFPKEIK